MECYSYPQKQEAVFLDLHSNQPYRISGLEIPPRELNLELTMVWHVSE